MIMILNLLLLKIIFNRGGRGGQIPTTIDFLDRRLPSCEFSHNSTGGMGVKY